MKTIKLPCRDYGLMSVVVKKEFEHKGVRLALHRPLDWIIALRSVKSTTEKVGWLVSEYTTGLSVGYESSTMAQAMDRAAQHINTAIEMGIDVKALINSKTKHNE